MSVKDLIANWEEALALAFSQLQDGDVIELTDGDLEHVAAPNLRSRVVAGHMTGGKVCSLFVFHLCHSAQCIIK